ncbi:MAG: alpha/beta fold hydrolase [Hyphomicrobiales bacterium]|nr:alpha/beta fold hydrolase [Hyphomicrobiales bacterium]
MTSNKTACGRNVLNRCHSPRCEHSVPFLWPFAAAIELGEEGMKLFQRNLGFLSETQKIAAPPPPEWATANRVLLDMDTMRLRDFGPPVNSDLPVLIDAPYAGHSSTIADYDKGQSLVETLLASGLKRVLVADWKAATPEMKDFDIDKYLAEINAAVDDLGGRVALVGLCQGGWMSSIYAARFPSKVRALVLAGSPIDTHAGDGPLKQMVESLPASFYDNLVDAGGGLMRGQTMLAGWKNMHPTEQFLGKYIDLYANLGDESYLKRTETFERWYENPVDLPGRYYLQAIKRLFRDNELARGAFVALGRRVTLKDVSCPLYLLAGEADDITTPEQVFAAAKLVATPPGEIEKRVVPGGHIGLFMGARTLAETWPLVGNWLQRATGTGTCADHDVVDQEA